MKPMIKTIIYGQNLFEPKAHWHSKRGISLPQESDLLSNMTNWVIQRIQLTVEWKKAER